MQFRDPPPPAPGAPRTVIVLFIWLAPVVALTAPIILSDDPSGRILSRPYLQVASAMPLRFAEAPPPPDLTSHLPAGAPPRISAAPAPEDTPAKDRPEPPVETHAAIKPSASANDIILPPEKEKASAPTPPAILPDDTHPKVKAEDFLPFFQFPGGATSDTYVPPQPGRQPPSTATYRQQ